MVVAKPAQPAPVVKAPEPSITITEVKAPGVIHETDHLEKSGDMIVEEFKPTEEDLVRLARSKASPLPMQAEPAPEVAAPAVLVAPSRAKQTMAEMERGAHIVKERMALRERMMAQQ